MAGRVGWLGAVDMGVDDIEEAIHDSIEVISSKVGADDWVLIIERLHVTWPEGLRLSCTTSDSIVRPIKPQAQHPLSVAARLSVGTNCKVNAYLGHGRVYWTAARWNIMHQASTPD